MRGVKDVLELDTTTAHEWGTRMLESPTSPIEMWGFGFGARLLGGLGHEVDEVLLPDDGLGVGAMAAGGVGDGDQDELGVGYPGDHFLGDA